MVRNMEVPAKCAAVFAHHLTLAEFKDEAYLAMHSSNPAEYFSDFRYMLQQEYLSEDVDSDYSYQLEEFMDLWEGVTAQFLKRLGDVMEFTGLLDVVPCPIVVRDIYDGQMNALAATPPVVRMESYRKATLAPPRNCLRERNAPICFPSTFAGATIVKLVDEPLPPVPGCPPVDSYDYVYSHNPYHMSVAVFNSRSKKRQDEKWREPTSLSWNSAAAQLNRSKAPRFDMSKPPGLGRSAGRGRPR